VKAPVTGQTPFASFDLSKTLIAPLAVKLRTRFVYCDHRLARRRA
jgi:hypothetical protein